MLQPNQQIIHQQIDRQMQVDADCAPLLSLTSNLEAIEHEWRYFEQRADCTPFQTFDWLNTWQHCIGAPAGVKPAIVVGRQNNGELLFILPFAIEQTRFFRRLVFLGHDLCDYNAPLLAPEFPDVVPPTKFTSWWRSVQVFLDQIAGYGHDVVLFTRMPAKVGQQENPLAALKTMPNPSSAHLSHLSENWDAFYASKQRSERRRRDRSRRKKLAETGELDLITPQDPIQIESTLKTLFDQKSRSFARMGVPNLFERPGHSKFFLTVATHATSLVHVSCLKVGPAEHIAAANLGLMFRNRYYQILVSYDDKLAQYAPGTIHLHELMRYAIERGYKYFDFTMGDERYKLDWADTTITLCDHVAASSLLGQLAAVQTRFKLHLKRSVKHSPRLFSFAIRLRSVLNSIKSALHQ